MSRRDVRSGQCTHALKHPNWVLVCVGVFVFVFAWDTWDAAGVERVVRADWRRGAAIGDGLQ